MAKQKPADSTEVETKVTDPIAAQQAGTTTEGASTEGTAAAGATTEATESERKTRAPAANFLPIVSGRLPLIFVHAIRFDTVLNAMSNKDLATKFGTSVGKVFDIKKGRNFSYVQTDFKPTTEDVAAAKAWAEKVGGENKHGIAAVGDAKVLSDLIATYEGKGLATAEEAAAMSAARTATRKTTAKPAVEGAPSGAAAPVANAEALLS